MAGALAGPLRDAVGFGWLAVASAVVVAAAAPVSTRRRTGRPAEPDPTVAEYTTAT